MPWNQPVSTWVIVYRIFWLILGPFLLMNMAYVIAERGGGWMTIPNLVFLGVLLAVIGARSLEFRSGDPRTSTGQPATREDLRRFVTYALAAGLAIWIVANLFGAYQGSSY
jgi:Flp pilus assembly protein TadB